MIKKTLNAELQSRAAPSPFILTDIAIQSTAHRYIRFFVFCITRIIV